MGKRTIHPSGPPPTSPPPLPPRPDPQAPPPAPMHAPGPPKAGRSYRACVIGVALGFGLAFAVDQAVGQETPVTLETARQWASHECGSPPGKWESVGQGMLATAVTAMVAYHMANNPRNPDTTGHSWWQAAVGVAGGGLGVVIGNMLWTRHRHGNHALCLSRQAAWQKIVDRHAPPDLAWLDRPARRFAR